VPWVQSAEADQLTRAERPYRCDLTSTPERVWHHLVTADYPPPGQSAPSPGAWAGWWQASDGNWYPPQATPGGAWSQLGRWGSTMSPSDERTWAMLPHLRHFFGSWIAQIIILCTQAKESPFVRDQAVEALNFTITLGIAAVVSEVLCLVLIGFFLLAGVIIVGIVFAIMGAIRSHRGETYRYPLCLRLIH
jgi:uncharacterized protein